MKTGGAERQEMGKENRFLTPPSKGGDRHIRKVEKEKTIAADRDRAGLTMNVPGPLFIGGDCD